MRCPGSPAPRPAPVTAGGCGRRSQRRGRPLPAAAALATAAGPLSPYSTAPALRRRSRSRGSGTVWNHSGPCRAPFGVRPGKLGCGRSEKTSEKRQWSRGKPAGGCSPQPRPPHPAGERALPSCLRGVEVLPVRREICGLWGCMVLVMMEEGGLELASYPHQLMVFGGAIHGGTFVTGGSLAAEGARDGGEGVRRRGPSGGGE